MAARQRHTAVVVEQFEAGARHFDAWQVTRDERTLRGLAGFCGLTGQDDVLDVACGTGAFALHAAATARTATGVDVTPGMIAVARENAAARGLHNASFHRGDVTRLHFPDGRFSVVACRSAFHHMPDPGRVLGEMVRCCRPGGSVVLQDVIAYDDPYVDAYFERLEVLVDRSHHRTWSKRELFTLFTGHRVPLEGLFESESLLDVAAYTEHVAQTAGSRAAVAELVAQGTTDPRTAPWFEERDGRLLWRRRVCTIKGRPAGRPGAGQPAPATPGAHAEDAENAAHDG
jgi:ubiquinone/menaquinone biosynthesis C-methylase UbiE